MASKPRMKMSAAERAKQFAPFSALKGLDEALKAKERILVERAELSEENAEEISRALTQLQRGDTVSAVYYSDGEYLTTEGRVTAIDKTAKKLNVVKTEIPFEDIYKIYIKS